ncbi:hypothetical protein [Paenibacillus rhizolycopersici]|uniref:hypothetical protein n=1 Tax=Paenibacillus rhizolycopersici TaxID=2780073 RepID=UPI003D2D39AE
MKTVWKVTTAAVLIGGSVLAGSLLNIQAEGAGTTPGTADDPVVTKSYVDQAIQQAINGGGGLSTPSTGSSSESSSEDGVQIVEVKPGKILVAAEGTEFIVRSGKAVIYSADSNGVADLTDGKDIPNGGAVANNHLLSFPREGRGIQVQDGDTHNLTVMVRGGYQIK